MKDKCASRDKAVYWGFLLCVFAFTAVYFIGCRPLIVSNGDDWVYTAFTRSALPMWKGWNPGKVLPEVFLPTCAQLGVTFIKPFCGDYIWSISLAAGIMLSLIITLYTGLFTEVLQHMLKLGAGAAVLVSAAFFLFHFKSWMSPWIPGMHLFYSPDLNNTFNYTVPALLNSILMLYLMKRRELALDHPHMIAEGILLLVLYLAVFSNMFLNCILAVYAGVCLLENLCASIARKERMISVLSRNLLNVYILGLWVVCAVFELSGGRAAAVSDISLIDSVKAAVWALLETIERMDDVVFFGCIALVAAGCMLLAFSRGRHETDAVYGKLMLRHAANVILVTIYVLLLGGVVGPQYVTRPDVLFAAMVHVLLMAFFSAAYMIKRVPKTALVLPAAVFVLSIEVCMGMSGLALTNTGNTTKHALDVNRNLVEQVVSADQQGLKEVTLIVPYAPTADNFPYPTYMGGYMLRTLRQHRMIENIDTIHIQPDQNYYSMFGIVEGKNNYSE